MKYENLYNEAVNAIDNFGSAYEKLMKFRTEFDKKLNDIENKQTSPCTDYSDPDYEALLVKWNQIELIIKNPLTETTKEDFS